jgi:hypothetical protein
MRADRRRRADEGDKGPFRLSQVESGASAQTPTVSITATDAAAAEAGANPGRFRLSRTGSTTNALTVQVRLRGSATQGDDYSFNIRMKLPHRSLSRSSLASKIPPPKCPTISEQPT